MNEYLCKQCGCRFEHPGPRRLCPSCLGPDIVYAPLEPEPDFYDDYGSLSDDYEDGFF